MPEPIKVFRRGEALTQGHYKQVQPRGGGGTTAQIMCPRCSLPLSLAGHAIDGRGYVSPGVACPCGWQAHIKLEGWGA